MLPFLLGLFSLSCALILVWREFCCVVVEVDVEAKFSWRFEVEAWCGLGVCLRSSWIGGD